MYVLFLCVLGDEYFADLDLIRAVTSEKEGYEEEAPAMSDDDNRDDNDYERSASPG